mgnify:FL=1|tara:strand:+ start:8163 stop:8609 length:447 start_codon:yes stop_codon:yes gene_type:complete
MNNERPSPDKNPPISIFKKTIIKKLEFLPYIDYVPSVIPTESGNTLLDELYIYEKIVDDHNQFELADLQNEDENTRRISKLFKYLRKREKSDSIEEKKEDIMTIRILTKRYENWSVKWDATSEMVGKELSLDEIDLIQSEIKRISRKL